MSKFQQTFDPQIWAVVSRIPAGQVMGYGEVARAAGFPRCARMVGAAIRRSPKPLHWYRVLRSDRSLAFKPGSASYQTQMQRLKQEGIHFKGNKVVVQADNDSLDKILWGPTDD